MHIMILGAFQDELAYFITQLGNLKETQVGTCRCLTGKWNNDDLTISLTGIGTNAAAITTTMLCAALRPDLIIFLGVAGGLKLEQQIGDLVLATKIIDADLYHLPAALQNTPYKTALQDPHTLSPIVTEYPTHPAILEALASFSFDRFTQGSIVSSNTFPAPKALFQDIKKLDCSAIEMECVGIAKAAAYYNVPVLAVRAISNLLDEAGNDLGTRPDELTICSERLGKFLLHLLQDDYRLPSIYRACSAKAIDYQDTH